MVNASERLWGKYNNINTSQVSPFCQNRIFLASFHFNYRNELVRVHSRRFRWAYKIKSVSLNYVYWCHGIA